MGVLPVHHHSPGDFYEFSESEKKIHIMSWFEGTDFPIEKMEDIQDIKILDEYEISFWHKNRLRNCPIFKRDSMDHIEFTETEHLSVSLLKMRIVNNAQQCLDLRLKDEPVNL